MSEPVLPDDDEAMLARLAQLDLTLAERVHAAAMAAAEPDEINALGRTYQRIARSLRQTLALKAKLKRDREADKRAHPPPPPPQPPVDWVAARRRQQALGGAVHRVIAETFAPESDDYDMTLDVLRDQITRQVRDPAFVAKPLDQHVLELCAILNLPLDLAERWRDLPEVVADADDDENDEDEDTADEEDDGALPAEWPAWRSSG